MASNPLVVIEPVNVAFFKDFARLGTQENEAVLAMFLKANREKIERFTGCDYVSKEKEKTFTINQRFDLDLNSVISVRGFYTKVADIASAYTYYVEYCKGISVNRQYPLDEDNLPSYTVCYQLVVDPTDVPETVKSVLCMVASDLYENREISGTASAKLSAKFKFMLAELKKYN